MKKYLLALGTVVATAAPIATVIACGSDDKTKTTTTTGGTDATPQAHPTTHNTGGSGYHQPPVTQADLDALVFPDITTLASTVGSETLKTTFATDTTGATRRQVGLKQGKLDIYLPTGTATWGFDETRMTLTFNVKAYSGTGDLLVTPVISSTADPAIKRVLPEVHIKTARNLVDVTFPLKNSILRSTTLHSSQAKAASDTSLHGVVKYMAYAFSVTLDVDTKPTKTIAEVESALGIDLGLSDDIKNNYKVKVTSTMRFSGVLRLDSDITEFPLTLTLIANDGTPLMNNSFNISVHPKD